MKSLDNKLIIYDSNCKVCTSLRDIILRITSIPEAKTKAFKDLDDDLSMQVDAVRFKNAMALIDTSGGATLYGAEGVAHIFSSQSKIVEFFFRSRPIFLLFTFFYRITAYNRYIIATPKSKFKCDCFPDRIVKYRISYILMTSLVAIFLTALFGFSLRNFFAGISANEAAIQMLLIAGSGWALQMVLATITLREKTLDYVGHLGSIMVVGLLILAPSIVFYLLTGLLVPYIPAVSVVISSACMLYLHINRVRFLELSQALTVSWFLFLQGTAAFWIYFFYFK